MSSECSEQVLHFGTFRFEPQERRLFEGENELSLNPKALDLLAYLVAHPHHIIAKEEILREVWNGTPVTDDALVQRVLDIRKALRDNPRQPVFIRTHSKRGYEWIASVMPGPVPATVAAAVPPPKEEPVPMVPARSRMPWVALGGLLLVLSGVWFLWQRLPDQHMPADLRMVRLTSLPGMEDYPAFEPGSKRMVFASDEGGSGNLWLLDTEGKSEPLTHDGQNDSEPDWSPDGKWIAFRSDRGQGGIYVLSLETRSVTLAVPFGHHPRWSPDSSRLLLHTEGSDARIYTWIRDTGKAGEVSVSSPSVTNRAFPVWSPDGREVYFLGMAPRPVSPEGSVVLGHQIWRVPVAGGEARLVTRGFGVVHDGGFDLEPRGQNLVFIGLDRSLWKAPVAGTSRPVRLTLTTEEHQHPRFGVRGEIVFATVASPDSLWMVPFGADSRPDERKMERLTREGVLARDPVVSPDGSTVAYVTWAGERFEIWCLDMTTRRTWRASPSSGPSRTHPLWSRDGKYLLYQLLDGAQRSDAAGRFDQNSRTVVDERTAVAATSVPNAAFAVVDEGKVFRVVAEAPAPEPASLSSLPHSLARPGPDGSSVFFQKAEGGWFNVWRLGTHEPLSSAEQVTHFRGSPYLLSDSNREFAIHPKGLILSLRQNRSDLWMIR